jgi:tetratricopeptide (TPR) repeat protein
VFEDLLDRSRRVFGPDARPTTLAQGELASIYHDLGRYADAQIHYEQTLAIEQRRSAGAPSMQVAVFTNNLATLLEDRGDSDEAMALYRESFAIREAALPEGHGGRSNPLHNLARLLLDNGDAAAALGYIERALALRREAFEETHPARLSSELLYARTLASTGELSLAQAALAEIEPLLAARIEEQPRLAIEYGLTRAGIAAVAQDQAERIGALDQAIAASTRLHGPTHPLTARLHLHRARARLASGDPLSARAEAASVAAVLDAVSVSDAPWRADLDRLLALD